MSKLAGYTEHIVWTLKHHVGFIILAILLFLKVAFSIKHYILDVAHICASLSGLVCEYFATTLYSYVVQDGWYCLHMNHFIYIYLVSGIWPHMF